MSRSIWSLAAGAVAVGALYFLLDAPAASSDDVQPVLVTNFPETQRVTGAVAVEGTIHQAALASIGEIEIPPNTGPDDARRMVAAGTISTDGFGAVVLSLLVHLKGKALRPGRVGAILIPEEGPISEAFDERGQLLFPLDVTAEIPALGPSRIGSSQPRYVLGFPRYRVFLYNTGASFVTADLYAYLTN